MDGVVKLVYTVDKQEALIECSCGEIVVLKTGDEGAQVLFEFVAGHSGCITNSVLEIG